MPSDLNSEERRHGRASQLEWSKSLYELTNYAVKSVLHLKKMVDPDETLKYWAYFAVCVTSISFDFLVFYIPVIDDDGKCLELDTQLGAKAILLRSFFDVFLTVIFFLERFSDSYDPTPARYGREKPSHITSNCFGYLSLFDLLLVLPLPQLLIWNITSNMMRLKFWDAMKLLKFCVFLQDVPRVIRIYPLFTKAIRTSENHAEATWVKAAFTFLLYMLAAYAFGAISYFTAIEKETECWEKAYTNQTGCNQLGSFYCGSSSRNYTFLDGFCPTKTRNTAVYDFGMFHNALQSGIVEVTNFPQKFLHCFLWGLQNLSCFGQNMHTSSNVWENLFAISITISGSMLLLFLFGNMQVYVQSKFVRSKERKYKVREIEEWKPFRKLS